LEGKIALSYIIAEIGSNWLVEENNDKKNTVSVLESIVKAKEAGADAVKFQLLSSKELYGHDLKYSPADKYHLKEKIIEAAAISCGLRDIDFMCSAFSKEGYDSINEYVKMHKVASCEATDLKLIDHVFALDKRVMVSTGGLLENQITDLIKRYPEGQLVLADCVIDYPADPSQYNLCIIAEWIEEYGMAAVAFSDHTIGYSTALAAQGLGATIFEKHVNMTGGTSSPDSGVSINPYQFSVYCSVLKNHRKHKRLLSPEEKINVEKYQRRQLKHGFYRPHKGI
jgi:sialic acid synthase SpsE